MGIDGHAAFDCVLHACSHLCFRVQVGSVEGCSEMSDHDEHQLLLESAGDAVWLPLPVDEFSIQFRGPSCLGNPLAVGRSTTEIFIDWPWDPIDSPCAL